MKCPHCKYQHGWNPEMKNVVKGQYGDFYRLSDDVMMYRRGERYWESGDEVSVFGCPSCHKFFMED